MGNEGLALLVVLGMGGFVLWYLTRPQAQPLVVKKDPPCAVGYAGITATCGALEEGGKVLYKYGSLVVNAFNPLDGLGSSKICRASNGKDVFPNDIQECSKRFGITDCDACGRLYNLQTRQWPWTPELNAKANLPAGTPAGATGTTVSGWRANPNPNGGETQVSQQPMIPIGKPAGYR